MGTSTRISYTTSKYMQPLNSATIQSPTHEPDTLTAGKAYTSTTRLSAQWPLSEANKVTSTTFGYGTASKRQNPPATRMHYSTCTHSAVPQPSQTRTRFLIPLLIRMVNLDTIGTSGKRKKCRIPTSRAPKAIRLTGSIQMCLRLGKGKFVGMHILPCIVQSI